MPKSSLTRRSFCLSAAAVAAAGALAPNALLQAAAPAVSGPRVRRPNPYITADGRPLVAVIRGDDFAKMLAKGMDLLGGFRPLGIDQPVLIKPNFVLPIPYPYTTDGPSIISLVDLLQHEGFSKITISDWGGSTNVENEPSTGAYEHKGLDEFAGPGRFQFRDLAGRKTRVIKDSRWTNMKEIRLRRTIHKAPLIINMPVLKEHDYCRFTCAVKNFVGVIDARSRLDMHYGSAEGYDPFRHTMRAVAEIAASVNPELTIVDARQVVGEHHYDPAKGTVVDCGKVIISGDMVAADLVASKLLGRTLGTYRNGDADLMLRRAAKLTDGPKSLKDVKVIKARAS